MCTTTETTIIKIHGLPTNFRMFETFGDANMDHTRINDIVYDGLSCGRNEILTMDQSTGTTIRTGYPLSQTRNFRELLPNNGCNMTTGAGVIRDSVVSVRCGGWRLTLRK